MQWEYIARRAPHKKHGGRLVLFYSSILPVAIGLFFLAFRWRQLPFGSSLGRHGDHSLCSN